MIAAQGLNRSVGADLAGANLGDAVVAVVIPSFRVKAHILPLLAPIGPEVRHVFVVDDACPEGSGNHVLENCTDSRVVEFHAVNQGVGGAVITGYQQALAVQADIVIKLDGDGQMDPALIPQFAAPIAQGYGGYVKGNRFYNPEDLRSMPLMRLVGNAGLSFMTKLSSGYWNIFDPTNGYTAISAPVLCSVPLAKIQRRYFFESDMLFRLGTVQACVVDMPMRAVYGDEDSGLRIHRILVPFFVVNLRNFVKRVFYSYFLRGFSLASLHLLAGLVLMAFGTIFGLYAWHESISTSRAATTGTAMLAALPVLMGLQLLLSFLAFDMAATPARAISSILPTTRVPEAALAEIRATTRCGAGEGLPSDATPVVAGLR